MSRKESLAVRLLYNTVPGRVILKGLVNPDLSEKAAVYLSSPGSKWLIEYYRKKYDIDMKGCREKSFHSFNDFFKRKKEINIYAEDDDIISPCDGFLSVYNISDTLVMNIKHSRYTVGTLLQDKNDASLFSGGLCMVFRLEPHHYHRYLYAADGKLKKNRQIPGILHCVRPAACRQYPVYIQNSREYTLIETSDIGSFVQMEVGAMLVGKIFNHFKSMNAVKGEEKGYFEYGGSTVILLFQKNSVSLNSKLKAFTDTEHEIPVKIGQIIARKNAR